MHFVRLTLCACEREERAAVRESHVRQGDWHVEVFWCRADLKWHGYELAPHVGSVEKFLAIVDEDKHACFFG